MLTQQFKGEIVKYCLAGQLGYVTLSICLTLVSRTKPLDDDFSICVRRRGLL